MIEKFKDSLSYNLISLTNRDQRIDQQKSNHDKQYKVISIQL